MKEAVSVTPPTKTSNHACLVSLSHQNPRDNNCFSHLQGTKGEDAIPLDPQELNMSPEETTPSKISINDGLVVT